MTTATEIATRAFRRIGVFDALETPSGADLTHATEALNAMIASWETSGLSGDVLPLDGRFEQAVVALLAMRLAEDYGKTPGPILARDADDGWKSLQAAFWAVPNSSFDNALITAGTNATVAGLTDDPVNYDAWAASTAYPLRWFARNNSNLYEVTTAGTSGVTGPSGTGSSISDGTVVWCFRRVLAE